MIEVHDMGRNDLPTVHARHVSKLSQQLCLLAAPSTLRPDPVTFLEPAATAIECASMCSCPVTIRADDVDMPERVD